MIRAIVDTNVAVTANGKAKQASLECRRSCILALNELKNDGKLYVDSCYQIINEYRGQLSERGQPGVGDAFLLWVLQNYTNPQRCELVQVTLDPEDEASFLEFPTDANLSRFDRKDCKFATIAAISGVPVWNAVDSDWWHYRQALHQNGIQVAFLCPDQEWMKNN